MKNILENEKNNVITTHYFKEFIPYIIMILTAVFLILSLTMPAMSQILSSISIPLPGWIHVLVLGCIGIFFFSDNKLLWGIADTLCIIITLIFFLDAFSASREIPFQQIKFIVALAFGIMTYVIINFNRER